MTSFPTIAQVPSRELLAQQRSHVLLILGNAAEESNSEFGEWYGNAFADRLRSVPGLLSLTQYVRHEVDVTQGQCPGPPFRYLATCDLSLDGAEQADSIVAMVEAAFRDEESAAEVAAWLYYPSSERVGRPTQAGGSLLTIAFANGLPGAEDEFREWYATRHIRHALVLPELVSGQCFARSRFQRWGAAQAGFSTVAIYEQDGSVEALMESLARTPPESLAFPTLDATRFGEAVYRPFRS